MATRGSLSDRCTPEEKAAARRKLERMMDPADAGNLKGIQKRRATSVESREAGCAWEQQYYQGVSSSKFSGLDAIFMLPLKHVEQIIIIPTVSISVTEDEAYQVIIVPTGAVGASSVKREYPQIVSFSWPDKAAGKDLHSHEAANPEKDTYLAVLVKAMNDHLKPFNKAVIDLTSDTGRRSVIEQTAILSPPTDSRVKAKTRGIDTKPP
ncbi:hypothetical protein N0V92_006285 [Colletotrichum tropicale]|nr:hypothetical protein N0V92_006285 [Colletotrichum tropicale]